MFDEKSEDKDIIENWLRNGSPLINETLDQEKKKIEINSHQNFKFQF